MYVVAKKYREEQPHEERHEEHHKEHRGHRPEIPHERDAERVMDEGFYEYVSKYGNHFTDTLADYVSERMENADGTKHRWAVGQVREAMNTLGLSYEGKHTVGDAAYLANMYYSDFYPKAIKEETDCIHAAYLIMTDPDGYDGMAFMRFVSDAIGKGMVIDWKKFM